MDGLALAAACLLLGIVVSIIIVVDVLNDRGARRFDRLVATRLAQHATEAAKVRRLREGPPPSDPNPGPALSMLPRWPARLQRDHLR
jgi:hypothetical protein